MKVKIVSDRPGRASVFLNGEHAKAIRALQLEMAVGEVPTVTLEHIPDAVGFEGEAQVIAVIDGRKYRLVEEIIASSLHRDKVFPGNS